MSIIRLSVDYYDATQEALFKKYPNWANINSFVGASFTENKGDILTYMMFYEQKEVDGFRTYTELQTKLLNRIEYFEDYFDDQLKPRFVGVEMNKDLTERMGVALGLSVISRIHNLHEADWKKIKEARGKNSGHPTLDFEVISISSTGSNFIQVENKGSIVVDNTRKSSTVSQHYSSIQTKKDYIREQEKNKGIPIHHNLYYGTIGVLDTIHPPKVWLVDPPAFEMDITPYKYKLLTRLRFYLNEFINIGIKKKITDALKARIEKIEVSQNIDEFNNKSLDVKNARNYPEKQYIQGNMVAAVNINEAFGKVFLVEVKQETMFFLIAFPKSIMQLILKQDFEKILAYDYTPSFSDDKVSVLINIKKNEWEKYNYLQKLKMIFSEKKGIYEAMYFGPIEFSRSGRIFGLLRPEFINRS